MGDRYTWVDRKDGLATVCIVSCKQFTADDARGDAIGGHVIVILGLLVLFVSELGAPRLKTKQALTVSLGHRDEIVKGRHDKKQGAAKATSAIQAS